jgi:O-antigen ligase
MYKPVAEQGGLFGWSATSYPRYPGYGSIDNQYLLMWVTNGKVGLGLFILIAAEAILGFALAIRRSRQPIDTCFYYCMEGAMVGLTVILATVWLVGQGFVFLFLFVGWSQSLRDQSETPSEIADKSDARFAFRRVLA